MKHRLLNLGLLAACVALGLGPAYAGITGSAHDFSSQGWSQGSLCKPCHTPHHADQTVPGSPLWNHECSEEAYTLYSSGTMDATVEQPTGTSKLCLGCHDGTVALDSFGGNSGWEMIGGSANLTTDLSGSHPISFIYDATVAADDGRLHDPVSAPSGLGGSIDDDLLINTRMECSSCHDVHNSDNNAALLRIPQEGGALCTTCHDM